MIDVGDDAKLRDAAGLSHAPLYSAAASGCCVDATTLAVGAIR